MTDQQTRTDHFKEMVLNLLGRGYYNCPHCASLLQRVAEDYDDLEKKLQLSQRLLHLFSGLTFEEDEYGGDRYLFVDEEEETEAPKSVSIPVRRDNTPPVVAAGDASKKEQPAGTPLCCCYRGH